VDENSEKKDNTSPVTETSSTTVNAEDGVPVRALFDYRAQEPDELSFTAGQQHYSYSAE